jgi:GxxExxY protein
MNLNELSREILNCAYNVHSKLGPGLLESSYEECCFYEISKKGILVQKQKPLPLIYEEVKLDIGYRVDLLIEDSLIVEIKSVDCLNDVHLAQILTYLRLSDCRLGLLINFNVKSLKNGIRRVVNNF